VTTEELQVRYPNLFERLEDRDVLMRHLVVVDTNEKDVTDDDIMEELYDPDTYTHVAYLYPQVVAAIGDRIDQLVERITQRDDVEECFVSEPDLWGLVTQLDEEAIAPMILDEIEAFVSETEVHEA
jgi:hypothetical protein